MASQRLPFIPIQDFNRGGLADSKFAGTRGSYYKLTGWDVHSTPGLAKVAQKLTKISPVELNEFCKAKVVSTNGKVYWFSAESGKIWQQNADDDNSFELVYTIVPTTGEAKILDAYEYQGRIYFATEKFIHMIDAEDAIGAANWNSENVSANLYQFTNGDKEFHPFMDQNLVLYIGDGSLLAQIDSGTFSPDALDIQTPLRIKSLTKTGTDILIGTYVSDFVTKTQLIRWNGWSDSYQVSNEINEVGINAFMQGDNVIFVQAGLFGRIYTYDANFNILRSFKKVPGEYSPTKYGTVNPNAVGILDNIILFGFSNILGNPADCGVYQIGRHSSNYPYILDFPYPISERELDDSFAISDVEIGAIAVRGFDIFISWKRTYTINNVTGYTFGVDKVDYSTKLDGAFFETRILISPNRTAMANYSSAHIAYFSLPDETAIELYLSPNYKAYTEITDLRVDEMRNICSANVGTIEATVMQCKVITRADGNNAPEIESAVLEMS